MPVDSSNPVRSRGLAWTASFGAAWVFVLVSLGAFTTSIGAGMVFADWPLSNGSLNPAGWLGDLAMFAEHSHRLSAGLMTAITLVLLIWVLRSESRRWVRRLAIWAMALVVFQALAGGLRVLLDHQHVDLVGTSLGRLFAMLHAGLAQIYVCLLLALAAGLSRIWANAPRAEYSSAVRRWGIACCALLLVQLVVAAVMRHSFAGLAISTVPWSTPEGGLLPASWDFRIGIHFAHRVLALILTVALPAFVIALWREPATGTVVRSLSLGVVTLLVLQVGLGIEAVRSGRNPHITTAHVLVGALTLATTFLLSLITHRSCLESEAPTSPNSGRAKPAPALNLASA